MKLKEFIDPFFIQWEYIYVHDITDALNHVFRYHGVMKHIPKDLLEMEVKYVANPHDEKYEKKGIIVFVNKCEVKI